MEPLESRMTTSNFSLKISSLLNIYLNLHCLTYSVKFKWKCKNFICFAFSTLFILANDINKLHLIIYSYVNLENKRSRYVKILILILEYLLRILFLLKRKNLKYLNSQMEKIYSSIVPKTKIKYRNALILALVINDIFIFVKMFLWFFSTDYFHMIRYHGNDFAYRYIGELSSNSPFYIFCTFLEVWGFITPFVPIYFCCLCLALKHIIKRLNKRLEKQKDVDIVYVDQICTEISNLTCNINESLHDIFLLAIVILLVRVFYHIYYIMIDKSLIEFLVLSRILNIIIYFIRFVAICKFASSTSRAGSALKRSIYNLNIKKEDKWEYFQLLFKLSDQFVEFKLLDSLILDKNLILAAMGSLVTYGIIIATFNRNSNM